MSFDSILHDVETSQMDWENEGVRQHSVRV
jgi:hypothetical protein